MSVKVRLPTAFKKFTEGEVFVEFEATIVPTVGALTEELFKRWPDLRGKMYERGALQRYVNIFVNGTDTRFVEGLDSGLVDGDEVQIVLAIAGG